MILNANLIARSLVIIISDATLICALCDISRDDDCRMDEVRSWAMRRRRSMSPGRSLLVDSPSLCTSHQNWGVRVYSAKLSANKTNVPDYLLGELKLRFCKNVQSKFAGGEGEEGVDIILVGCEDLSGRI